MPSTDVKTDCAPNLASSRSWLPKLLASLLISAGFIWALRQGGLPIVPDHGLLDGPATSAILGYALLQSTATFLRTYRWNHLLAAVAEGYDRRRVLGIGFIGYTAIFFAPLRLGEAIRPWLVAQDGRISFLQATATITAERLIDGVTLVAILLGGMLLSTQVTPLPDHVGGLAIPVSAIPSAAIFTCLFFVGGFTVMVLFFRFRELTQRLVELCFAWAPGGFAPWLSGRLERLAEGLTFLRSWRRAGRFLLDTGLYWGCGTLSTWLLLRGVGIDATASQACVVIGVTGLGTLVPSGPGFFGTYQLATYAALAMFYVEPVVLTRGAMFAFWSYAVVVAVSVLSCLLGFALMFSTRSRRN